MKKYLLLFTIVLLHIPFIAGKGYATRWPVDKINAWYAQREWLRGATSNQALLLTSWKCGKRNHSTP